MTIGGQADTTFLTLLSGGIMMVGMTGRQVDSSVIFLTLLGRDITSVFL